MDFTTKAVTTMNTLNQSPYRISGTARRELKKELSYLKRSIKYQPHYVDLCNVYGTPLDSEKEQDFIDRSEKRIIEIERLLMELRI